MDICILYENKDKLVIEQKGDMKIKSVEMGHSRINKSYNCNCGKCEGQSLNSKR